MSTLDEKQTHIVVLPRESHINKFYGDGDPALTNRFSEEVKAAWASRHMSPEERLRLLMGSIGETVRAEVKCHDKTIQSDPDKVLDLIMETFGERRSGSQLLSGFVGLKQRMAESVMEYSHRMNRAFDSVKGKTPDIDVRLLRDHFIEGLATPILRRELKEEVHKDPQLTFLQVRNSAIRRSEDEDQSNCSVDKVSVPEQKQSPPTGTGTVETMMAQLLAHLDKVDQRLERLESRSTAENQEKNGTKQRQVGRPRPAGPSLRWTADGRPICLSCSQPGHMARYCQGNGRPL
jgi:hypothetical protein